MQDDYDAFEEAEEMEDEAERQAKAWSSVHVLHGGNIVLHAGGGSMLALDADGDGIDDLQEHAIEAKEAVVELRTAVEMPEDALVERDMEMDQLYKDLQATVSAMKPMLSELAKR